MAAKRPLRIALVAGEKSGDTLGAGLIEALREREPDAEFFGIAGELMTAAGCEPWFRTEELSVMGVAEVLRHLPRLLSIRRALVRRLERERPDVLIGIDSPDFNIPVERRLKRSGMRTIQYVSPQVWAWRQSRVATMRAAVDLVLCVLPFEADFYDRHDVNARFVGHPLADAIPLESDRAAARAALGFGSDAPLVALLPGSRGGEVARLARPFVGAAAWLAQHRPGLNVVVALANDEAATVFDEQTRDLKLYPMIHRVQGRTREVVTAADAVLTASGTATLETMLLKRPMVVAYKLAPLSYAVIRRLGLQQLAHFSLPNLLAQRQLVPEFRQAEVCPEVLGPALGRVLEGEGLGADWYDAFGSIHRDLKLGASAAAAEAVLELIDQERVGSARS